MPDYTDQTRSDLDAPILALETIEQHIASALAAVRDGAAYLNHIPGMSNLIADWHAGIEDMLADLRAHKSAMLDDTGSAERAPQRRPDLRGNKHMKFSIKDRWTGKVLFEANLGAKYDKKSDSVRLGAAVKLAIKAGANLACANLACANLADADLAGAYLVGADLADANLTGADLTDADLTGTNLARANLARAYLAGAYLARANLAGAYLARADLARANLADADLARADLAGADLARANLAGAYLADADLTDANLAGAYLAGADLADANLAGANLAGADLARADLAGADLAGADLADAYLARADLAGVNLARANLARAYLAGVNLAGVNLAGANLARAKLAGADLAGANLAGADLADANLADAYLARANLADADLARAYLVGAYLARANLAGAKNFDPAIATPLLILLDQPGKIRAYKLVNGDSEGIHKGGIVYTPGETVAVENANTDPGEHCGAGINVATLDWCLKEWRQGYRVLIVEFTAADIACIPTAMYGKFRLHRATVIGEKDISGILRQLGRIETHAEAAA